MTKESPTARVALVFQENIQAPKAHIDVYLHSLDDISAIPVGSDQTSNGNDDIPESVLLYERQLRKAQHAKKVGHALKLEDLHVVHVDEHIVVVNKPPGVLTVPGINANPSLLDLVYETYGDKMDDPQKMIVHRLDMDTSGLVIFARSPDMTKQLHAMFRDQLVSKQYECLVMGRLTLPHFSSSSRIHPTAAAVSPSRLHINLPLQRDHENPPFMRVSTPHSEAAAMACVDELQKHGWKKLVRKRPKPSQTVATIVEHGIRLDTSGGGQLPFTRLRLEPITGRTHQLRVHW